MLQRRMTGSLQGFSEIMHLRKSSVLPGLFSVSAGNICGGAIQGHRFSNTVFLKLHIMDAFPIMRDVWTACVRLLCLQVRTHTEH